MDCGIAVRNFAKAIQHGDEEHRQWLTDAAEAFLDGGPMPPARGQGSAATISRLTAERDGLFDQLDFGKKLGTNEGFKIIANLKAERDALKHDIERHLAIMSEMQAERDGLRKALGKCAGAFETVLQETGIPKGMKMRFTGRWEHLGTESIKAILDEADALLATPTMTDAVR